MSSNDYSDQMIDRLHQALNTPETVSDEEMEQWTHDPSFNDALDTMLMARRAMLGEQYQEDTSQEAFRQFMAAHEPTDEAVEVPIGQSSSARKWWKASILAIAAATLGWWFLPRFSTDVPVAQPSNIIYHQTSYLDTVAVRPLHDNSQYQQSRSTITVPQGQHAMITLPDGSKVWLNAQSSLSYPNTFEAGQPRQVMLKGEAYFEVVRDEQHPFIVDCGKLHTRVLGTSFNVRNYPESSPCVTLVSGSVQVQEANHRVLLKPNQAATLSSTGALRVDEADIDNATCWLEGLFRFDGMTLREILVEVGRWYNMDVVVNDDTHLDDRLHFSGERQWTVNEVIEYLELICDVRLDIENKQIVIK